LLPPVGDVSKSSVSDPINSAFLDNNNVNFLYQQPHLIPIIEQLIQQEQQRQQQSSLFSQRSFGPNSIEIESFDPSQVARRVSPSQYYTIQAIPKYDSLSDLQNGRLSAHGLQRR